MSGTACMGRAGTGSVCSAHGGRPCLVGIIGRSGRPDVDKTGTRPSSSSRCQAGELPSLAARQGTLPEQSVGHDRLTLLVCLSLLRRMKAEEQKQRCYKRDSRGGQKEFLEVDI